MKRVKKALVKRDGRMVVTCSLICPHCKARLQGGDLDQYVLRISCWHCKNPIDLVHEEE